MASTTLNTIELIEVGQGVGLLLPPEMLARLGIKSGDSVIVQPNDNGLLIRPMTEHERQLELAEEIMTRRHDMLRRLAE